MKKIRNTKKTWGLLIGSMVHFFDLNSDWSGSAEMIDAYVLRVTNRGVWFSSQKEPCDSTIYWVNFNKIEAYLK